VAFTSAAALLGFNKGKLASGDLFDGEFANLLRAEYDLENDIGPSAEVIDFAAHIANDSVIPFEHSPLGAESLTNIASMAARVGGAGVGTAIGYVAGGPTPYLLITVPLGIILCGASFSLAKWLEENRNNIWKRILLERKKTPTSTQRRSSTQETKTQTKKVTHRMRH